MRAAAGAISRARAKARAHFEMAEDCIEIGEIHGGQSFIILNLAHA